MMMMRELITERILLTLSAHELMAYFRLTEADLDDLSDFDLLEVYEETIDIILGLSEIAGAPWNAGKPPKE
jgi:hypothetical protein